MANVSYGHFQRKQGESRTPLYLPFCQGGDEEGSILARAGDHRLAEMTFGLFAKLKRPRTSSHQKVLVSPFDTTNRERSL
jgi:hypothetical protein